MEDPWRGAEALLCDTNVIVRLLSAEPPEHAVAAARALDRAAADGIRILLPAIVIAEAAYVLTKSYGRGRSETGAGLGGVIDHPAVDVAEADAVRDAITIWVGSPLDFADAYLGALSRRAARSAVLSFDRDFDRVEGVRRIDPADV